MNALLTVRFTEKHQRSGRNGLDTACGWKPDDPAQSQSLVIAQYPDDAGFYLLSFRGKKNTGDTWHLSLPEAMDQAAFQYGVQSDEWEKPPVPSPAP
jgi:hypothetical protein